MRRLDFSISAHGQSNALPRAMGGTALLIYFREEIRGNRPFFFRSIHSWLFLFAASKVA